MKAGRPQKLRKPQSIEDAIAKIIGALGRDEAGAAVGKSPQMVYRWGDPDEDKARPSVQDAMALDIAYVAAGCGEAPILAAYRARLAAIGVSHVAMHAADRLCEVMHQIGDVAGEVRAALDPRSDGGASITRAEHAAMSAEIAEAIAGLQALQRDIDHAAGVDAEG